MPYTFKKRTLSSAALLLGVIACAAIALVFTNMKDAIFGTPFSVNTAKDGATVQAAFLPVSGNAGRARDVFINGRPVALDREGNFADAVLLSPGYNTVAVSLRDQFGKEKTRLYHLVLEGESAGAIAQTPNATYQQ
ncbi:MAG TPA: hypothetical protein VG982_03050 [Candidatus Paceibacterota bacterium]|jgi:hypothetical protein|nr:hypothetical protein [Candidatus Paceibacterota bacterium]